MLGECCCLWLSRWKHVTQIGTWTYGLLTEITHLVSGLNETRVLNVSWQKEFNETAAAKSLQSSLTLYDPMDYSPPGFSVPGNLQARILEWVVVPSFRWPSQPRDWTCISCIYLHWQTGFLPLAPPGKPQICRWYHSDGREWRRTKEFLDETERGEWKSWLESQHSKN